MGRRRKEGGEGPRHVRRPERRVQVRHYGCSQGGREGGLQEARQGQTTKDLESYIVIPAFPPLLKDKRKPEQVEGCRMPMLGHSDAPLMRVGTGLYRTLVWTESPSINHIKEWK